MFCKHNLTFAFMASQSCLDFKKCLVTMEDLGLLLEGVIIA